MGCSSQGGWLGSAGGEVTLLGMVVLRRRVVGTGCWWGLNHCQKPWLAEGKVMQDLHGSSQIIRAGRSARARGKGSYADPYANQA